MFFHVECTVIVAAYLFIFWIIACHLGPKLFKKPSQKSNRHIIVNAISHCCLAGTVNTAVKDKVLDVSGKNVHLITVLLCISDNFNFLSLFKSGK